MQENEFEEFEEEEEEEEEEDFPLFFCRVFLFFVQNFLSAEKKKREKPRQQHTCALSSSFAHVFYYINIIYIRPNAKKAQTTRTTRTTSL